MNKGGQKDQKNMINIYNTAHQRIYLWLSKARDINQMNKNICSIKNVECNFYEHKVVSPNQRIRLHLHA